MQKDFLHDFNLVGGTALALLMGHRTSTDIDLFVADKPDFQLVADGLRSEFQVMDLRQYSFAVFCFIEGVKTDLVYKPGKIISPFQWKDGIRLSSLQDLAAYKLEAVTNRGKCRDFFDVFCLLEYFTLEEMLGFWRTKFNQESNFTAVRSLTYFDDAAPEPDLKYFNKTSWPKIQKRLTDEVKKLR